MKHKNHIMTMKDSSKKRKRKKPFSVAKAKKILSEKHPMLHGRLISHGQRGLLGLIAGGGTPRKLS